VAKLGKTPVKRRGKAPKVAAVAELESLFKSGDGLVFFDNNGLTVKQVSTLRRDLRGNNVAVKVAKNTLIRIALKNAGREVKGLESKLHGPTVVAVGMSDPVSPAKGIVKFAKDNEEARLVIKAGLIGSDVLDADGVQRLSAMPGKEELLSRLLGSMLAPAQNMACAMNNAVAKFAWALQSYHKKLEESAPAA